MILFKIKHFHDLINLNLNKILNISIIYDNNYIIRISLQPNVENL